MFGMVDDVLYGKQQMAGIKLEGLPPLWTHFDPIRWQAQNPQYHPEVYKLNPEQLKYWGEEATEIRKKIIKKAEIYR